MQKQWGVWITHDIDHIRVREHYFRDLFLFRLCGVSLIEVLKGRRSIGSYCMLELSFMKPDAWEHFDEWIRLERRYRIPSTYFFAVNRGKSLSYTNDEVKPIAQKLRKAGFDLGLHGQRYEGEREIRREYELFNKIAGISPKGIRMHYLHIRKETFRELTSLYMYDSSVYAKRIEQPKKTLHMLEIPLHVMDTYLFSPFYENLTFEGAVKRTKKLLAEAKRKKAIVVFDIHPHHLDDAFPRQKKWILWLYEYIAKDRTCRKFSNNDILEEFTKTQ